MEEILSIQMLEAFVEVARSGSVTSASRSLGRSQPAISHRLKALEEALALPVLEKVGRQLHLTPQGEIFLKECEQILARLRALPGMLELEESQGGVTIGTFATLSRYLLIDPLAQAMEAMPHVRWSVQIGVAEGLFDALRQGSIDVLYLIGDFAIDEALVEATYLGDVRASVVLSPELWPYSHRPTTEDLRRLRLLLWRGMRDPSFELVEAHARSLGLVSETTFEVPQIETLRELARRGLGYTLLPDYIAREDVARGELKTFVLEGMERSFPIKQYHLRHRQLSLAQRTFMRDMERLLL